MQLSKLTVELNGLNKHEYVVAKQGDVNSRVLSIKLIDNGRVYLLSDNHKAMFYLTKPDGKEVFTECNIENNYVNVKLTEQMLAVTGEAKGEIIITEKNTSTILKTSTIIILIMPSEFNNSEILSSNEYAVLIQKVQEVDNINEKFKEILNQSTYESLELAKYGKQVIADAITAKGIITNNTASFEIMANNIRNIRSGSIQESDNYASNFLKNKKILWIGDSWFAGAPTSQKTNSKINELLDPILSIVSTNVSVAGSSFMHDDPQRNAVEQLDTQITANGLEYDLIMLSCAGNDAAFSLNDSTISIGHFTDKNNLLGEKTIIGRFQKFLNKVEAQGKLKNLLYILGARVGTDSTTNDRIKQLLPEIMALLKAYGVAYCDTDGLYTLAMTVNSDGMHPNDATYKDNIFPKLVPYMIYTYINSGSNSNVTPLPPSADGGGTGSDSSGDETALVQGSMVSNGIKLDVEGNKLTFTAQSNVGADGILFLITGASLQGGKTAGDFDNRLSDRFFGCDNGDTVEITVTDVTTTTYTARGYVSLLGVSTNSQVICFVENEQKRKDSAVLVEPSLGIMVSMANINAGESASYRIIVKKNGIEIGN